MSEDNEHADKEDTVSEDTQSLGRISEIIMGGVGAYLLGSALSQPNSVGRIVKGTVLAILILGSTFGAVAALSWLIAGA